MNSSFTSTSTDKGIEMSDVLCIYHGKCADGFTAAWAVHSALGNIDFYPGIYGEAPPDVTGREVILVDFSYKRPVLEEMAKKAKRLLILDHHVTAQADLAEVPKLRPDSDIESWLEWGRTYAALFDMNRSGAGIAWDFFHPKTRRCSLINYVEDRDLWRHALPRSHDINAAIYSYDFTFENWDRLAEMLETGAGALSAADQGAGIVRNRRKDLADLIEVGRRRMRIGGIEVWAANLPYTLKSDAGNIMAQGEPFAASYYDTPGGRYFSLRSTADGMDVSAIAAAYGGGGHKNAGAFRVPLDQIAQFEIG